MEGRMWLQVADCASHSVVGYSLGTLLKSDLIFSFYYFL